MSSSEQHANIKFCVSLWKSPSEKIKMLTEAYRNEAMKKSQCTIGTSIFMKIAQTQNMTLAASTLPLPAVRKTLSTFSNCPSRLRTNNL